MNIRILTASAAGLTLFALACPTAALAKDSAVIDFGTKNTAARVLVIAQDGGGDTGGESDDSACVQSNNTANEVLDAAGAAFEENDMEYGFALLDLVDAIEADAAAEGCTIKYT